MKSFRKNVPSRIGFSEENPARCSRASELGVSVRVENLDVCRSNRPALGRCNPESTAVVCDESPSTGAAPPTGDCLPESPASAASFSTEGIGAAFPNKPKPEDESWNPKIGSFEALVGGIQDAPARGSPGSLLSQNSSVFCSPKRMASVKYSDSLQLNCTEGLGFESSDEREDSVSLGSDHSTASSPRLHVKPGYNNNGEADGDQAILSSDYHPIDEEQQRGRALQAGPPKRPTRPTGSFPPPLPSIARNGQPWIILRSFRTDGRFVLQEVKAPPHEILHAWRQDGRLKLQLVHREDEGWCPPPDDDTPDGDGDGDGDESANPVENEKGIAEVADVEIDGSQGSSEILH